MYYHRSRPLPDLVQHCRILVEDRKSVEGQAAVCGADGREAGARHCGPDCGSNNSCQVVDERRDKRLTESGEPEICSTLEPQI